MGPRLRKAVGAFGLGIAIAGSNILAPAAEAATPSMSSTGGWYECTNQSAACPSRGSIGAGTSLTMHCWIDDAWATGAYRTNRWFFVTSSTGVRGFVHASRVRNQVSTPHCSTHRGIFASRWAAMHLGATRPTTAERGVNSAISWSGWCYLFAYDAHALSHGYRPYSGFGSAKNTYYAYKRNGRLSTNVSPQAISIGSIVFWPGVSSFGHAAIYVGNGYVASTRGVLGESRPISRVPLTQFGPPAGWVAPSNI